MRFRNKVLMWNITILSIALGVLGFVMIYANFSRTLKMQRQFSIEENNLLQNSVEYYLLDGINDKDSNLEGSIQYAGTSTGGHINSDETVLILMLEDIVIYSNASENIFFPKEFIENIEVGGKYYSTWKDGKNYSLMVGSLSLVRDKNFYIITVRDVSETYKALYDQIALLIVIVISVILISGIVMYVISTKLTKPLESLNLVTDSIVSGDYSLTAEVNSDDEIGELAKKFNDMTISIGAHVDELNQMVKRREQFVADFTHEIKTPMTAIIGYADTLKQNRLKPEQQQIAYQYIYSEGKRLETMSLKLFDLIYLKDNEIVFSEEDTLKFVEEIKSSMTPLLAKKNIALETDIEPAKIYCEPELLKTVFINLIDNARKATDAGGRIAFRGFKTSEGYAFEVEDWGIGMDEETVVHISDEFFMADKSRTRQEGGAGLGMSLSAVIVEKHNAVLEISSEIGKGTLIKVTLPKDKLVD